MKKSFLLFLLLAFLSTGSTAFAATYNLNKEHTSVNFKIKHVFSWVRGAFNDFEGSFVYDPENPQVWTANASIEAASIDTNNADRDKHLKSKDFFDVETYPTLSFTSTGVSDVTESGAKLHGILSIHGVEKEVVLDLDILGVGEDAWGNTLAGFSASTTINRKDFGLNWNKVLETGGVLVGEEVEITIDVEGILAE